jgi:hypothetical protein
MKGEENTPPVFPQETVNTLLELGKMLETIYKRMNSEGYDIIDDKIIHLATGKEYDPSIRKKQKSYKGN